MLNVLEAVLITVLSIGCIACLGYGIDLAYDATAAAVVKCWRWAKRQYQIAVLRADMHGYEMDKRELLEARPFNAAAYAIACMNLNKASDELAALLGNEQPQPLREEV